MKGVPVSAGLEEVGEATVEVMEDGAGDGTATLARDEFVAEFHSVESIVLGVMRAWRENKEIRRTVLHTWSRKKGQLHLDLDEYNVLGYLLPWRWETLGSIYTPHGLKVQEISGRNLVWQAWCLQRFSESYRDVDNTTKKGG